MEKYAQSMLQFESLHALFALGRLDNISTSPCAGTCVTMRGIFRRSVRHFSASSSELRPVVTGSCQFISTSCGHTHPVSVHALETTTTQQQHTNSNTQHDPTTPNTEYPTPNTDDDDDNYTQQRHTTHKHTTHNKQHRRLNPSCREGVVALTPESQLV